MIFALLWACLRRFPARKVSSKPARVTIAGSRHMLAVAEVSDSLGSLPPNLIVYSVGQMLSKADTISGPCYSLGRALVPYHFGFIASAPAAAFRWGDPHAIIARVFPPAHEFVKVKEARAPYGETLGASKLGNVVVACSPLSSCKCLVTDLKNRTWDLKADSDIRMFGLGVAVSPNGTVVAVLSRDSRDSVIQFFKNDGTELARLKVGVDIDPRSASPILHFRDERHLYLALPSAQKMFMFKVTVNGWILMEYKERNFISVAPTGDRGLISVTTDGRVTLLDKDFDVRWEEIVPRSVNGGRFVDIAAGDDWFAVLEESSNKRRLHVYSMKGSRLLRGIFWFIGSCAVVLLVMFTRGHIDASRLPRSKSKRNLETKSV